MLICLRNNAQMKNKKAPPFVAVCFSCLCLITKVQAVNFVHSI